MDLLSHEDVDVRIAAAETLALIASVAARQADAEGEEYSPYSAFNGFFDVQDALEALSNPNSTEVGSKKVSKFERAKQRRGFKGLLQAFEVPFPSVFEHLFSSLSLPRACNLVWRRARSRGHY